MSDAGSFSFTPGGLQQREQAGLVLWSRRQFGQGHYGIAPNFFVWIVEEGSKPGANLGLFRGAGGLSKSGTDGPNHGDLGDAFAGWRCVKERGFGPKLVAG
jgi:hypothetical protein